MEGQAQHPLTISKSTTIPTVLIRVSLLTHLFNDAILNWLPKRLLSSLLPSSWLSPAPLNSPKPPPSPASPPASMADGVDPAELKRVFQLFDQNSDGRISKKELSDSLDKLGIYIPEDELIAMIEKIDVNRDGCVDIEEFGALYETIMDEKNAEDDIREAFKVFDQNGDGYITVEELRSVLNSLGLKQGRTAEDCKRMISKVDKDGDGMVDFKEFKQMMRGGGFAALES
ncbi:EF hand calcium-binding family protein [Rhynchospora pubera]|uniref:EF hand calcium-binding family protein n=1 Tax=Rhynchospora pubera TaxID=906938 RepID=A0AAV8D1F8_9POAL|nr:EF hand calcium-binding family protein [Rhynchospora pubera]KAJ4761849.1 EF hand calcium-binding family protein [Rhynchospora pubera]